MVRPAILSINPLDVDVAITRFCSADRGDAGYFINEVLQAVPSTDREFLWKASMTEMVNGDLADQLTGRSDSPVCPRKEASSLRRRPTDRPTQVDSTPP